MLLLHDIELTKLVNSTFSLDDHISIARRFTQNPSQVETKQLFDFDANMLSFFIDYLVPEYLNGNTLSHRTDLDVKYEYRLGELAKQQYKSTNVKSLELDKKQYSMPNDAHEVIIRYTKPDIEKVTNFTSKVSTNINYGNLNITVSYPREDIVNTLLISGFEPSSTTSTITNREIFAKFQSQFSIGELTIKYELPEPASTKIIKNKPIIPEHQLGNTDYLKFTVGEIGTILTTVDLFGDIKHDY
jgi:hypothetical protein